MNSIPAILFIAFVVGYPAFLTVQAANSQPSPSGTTFMIALAATIFPPIAWFVVFKQFLVMKRRWGSASAVTVSLLVTAVYCIFLSGFMGSAVRYKEQMLWIYPGIWALVLVVPIAIWFAIVRSRFGPTAPRG